MASRSRGFVLLLLALAAGVTASWLALRYLREQTRPLLSAQASRVRAVVATRDLPVGTLLTENDVRLVDWPGNALPAGLMSDPAQAIGRGLLGPVRLNEPLLDPKLAPREARGGLPILISEGMRALTVRVDEVAGVAGFVRPNTRVDILLTLSDGPPINEPLTRVLLQNVQALSAGQSYQTDAQGQPQVVPTLTLLLTPEQAETLALASGQGRLQMTLRNQLDTLLIQTQGARRSTLLSGARAGTSPRVTARGPLGQATRPTPVDETVLIEGFRGGSRTVDRFTRPRPPEDNQ